MEHKIVLLVAVGFLFIQNVNSLNCYTCASKEPEQTCASPLINTTQSLECGKTASINNTRNFFDNNILEDTIRAASNSTEYQCLVFEKFYKADNKTETTRGCILKIDFCALMSADPDAALKYKLTRCETCTTDNCNGSVNLQISIFLFMVVFLINYIFN